MFRCSLFRAFYLCSSIWSLTQHHQCFDAHYFELFIYAFLFSIRFYQWLSFDAHYFELFIYFSLKTFYREDLKVSMLRFRSFLFIGLAEPTSGISNLCFDAHYFELFIYTQTRYIEHLIEISFDAPFLELFIYQITDFQDCLQNSREFRCSLFWAFYL